MSNRLPVTLTQTDNQWNYSMSSGGLVSALSGLHSHLSFTWIGWPGLHPPVDDHAMITSSLQTLNCVPVFIDEVIADRHYNGFSNSMLWPLFHYHPGEVEFCESDYEAYVKANERFSEVVAGEIQDGDMIWIHDYHLMLLPALLRKKLDIKGVQVKIGFFLHTPFPSSEIYRILPVRKQVLEGVLASDLVGFQTYDYARHFGSSCMRILGLRTRPDGVEYEGRVVKVGTFPIGIDAGKFERALSDEGVCERVRGLKEMFKGVKVLIGVDRFESA